MSAIDGFVIESEPVAHFGVGVIGQLPGVIRAAGADQVVVVTDDALASTLVIATLTDGCGNLHVGPASFRQAASIPSFVSRRHPVRLSSA